MSCLPFPPAASSNPFGSPVSVPPKSVSLAVCFASDGTVDVARYVQYYKSLTKQSRCRAAIVMSFAGNECGGESLSHKDADVKRFVKEKKTRRPSCMLADVLCFTQLAIGY
jgi:hypothetical protein